MHIIIQRAVLTWEYWVYISVFCTCAGSGQMILTNLYQIADASGYAERSEALLCLETWPRARPYVFTALLPFSAPNLCE